MKHFGEKIKNKRNELKLTQTEVGERIYVSRQTISSWENGKSYPDIPMLVTLSDFYDLSLDYLLKEDNFYMSKLKKEKKLLRIFFVIQVIMAISIGTHSLIISGNTLIGMLSSLVIFIITFYTMISVNNKYIKNKKSNILPEDDYMFEKHSETSKFLIIVASISFLVNIFISVLSYTNNENISSILIIIVSVIALLIIFFSTQKNIKKSKDKRTD